MHARMTISCTVAIVLCVATDALAVVESVTAEIRSTVQAFVNDVAESSDEAIENFGESGLLPPIDARAILESLDEGDAISAKAIALSEFRDPTIAGAGRNPEEIAIEANCFSSDASTRYELTSSVVERRMVSFSADELGDPTTRTQTVRSAVFASGAIFAWSTSAQRDLTGLLGEVTFVVRKIDADETETVLVSERVALRGGPNGTIAFEDANNLLVFAGDLAILPDDAGSASVPGLPDIEFAALASAQVAVILQQDLEYDYTVTPGEQLTLEAEFTTNVANLPDGTGVVAVFGRPFDEAAEIIELGIPADSAKRLETRLNRAIAEFKPAGASLSGTPLGWLCGILGIEMLPLLALSYALFHTRGSGRRRS